MRQSTIWYEYLEASPKWCWYSISTGTLVGRAFNSQDFYNIVWAFATAGESNPSLLKEVANDVVVKDTRASALPSVSAH